MKKFYETPMVEFTVFDVEDVITTSAIMTGTMDASEIDTLIAEIEADAAVAGVDVLGNYHNASYQW